MASPVKVKLHGVNLYHERFTGLAVILALDHGKFKGVIFILPSKRDISGPQFEPKVFNANCRIISLGFFSRSHRPRAIKRGIDSAAYNEADSSNVRAGPSIRGFTMFENVLQGNVARLNDLQGALSDGSGTPVRPDVRDAELLDAYSQAVVNVVEKTSPAVISVSGRRNEKQVGSGSGFIITPDGYAVTNSHVVAGRSRLSAETAEGDSVDAEVIGDDQATDLAVLRLAARDLPYAELGASDSLRVGQLVIAMGSPMGLHATISTGVVSALGRSMRGQDGRLIESIVQHSAPINPGNSGGPLVDSRGRVVGVNTAIIAFAQGLGFAVPSSTTRWVISEILQHGKVRRRQLGIKAAGNRIPRFLIRQLDLLSDQVVEVIEVINGSVAHTAGIRAGDFIVAINDRIIANVDDVHRILSAFPMSTPLEVMIVRNGSKQLLHIPPPGSD